MRTPFARKVQLFTLVAAYYYYYNARLYDYYNYYYVHLSLSDGRLAARRRGE